MIKWLVKEIIEFMHIIEQLYNAHNIFNHVHAFLI